MSLFSPQLKRDLTRLGTAAVVQQPEFPDSIRYSPYQVKFSDWRGIMHHPILSSLYLRAGPAVAANDKKQ